MRQLHLFLVFLLLAAFLALLPAEPPPTYFTSIAVPQGKLYERSTTGSDVAVNPVGYATSGYKVRAGILRVSEGDTTTPTGLTSVSVTLGTLADPPSLTAHDVYTTASGGLLTCKVFRPTSSEDATTTQTTYTATVQWWAFGQ